MSKQALGDDSNNSVFCEIKDSGGDRFVDNLILKISKNSDDLAFSSIESPSCNNQSTPKKPLFTSKVEFFVESYY